MFTRLDEAGIEHYHREGSIAPGDGYETPWHQDGHYWPIRPLATGTFDERDAVDIELEPSWATTGIDS